MDRLLLILSILLTLLTFGYYILGIMDLASLFLAVPLFLISIFITVLLFNNFNRFKGVK